jgi:putative hemolysin
MCNIAYGVMGVRLVRLKPMILLLLAAAGMTEAEAVYVLDGCAKIQDNSLSWVGLPDPAVVYSLELGYNVSKVKSQDGSEYHVVIFPDSTSCSVWDFYTGKCGTNWSFCARCGWRTMTEKGKDDPYSPEYAVCIEPIRAHIKYGGGNDSGDSSYRIIGPVHG